MDRADPASRPARSRRTGPGRPGRRRRRGPTLACGWASSRSSHAQGTIVGMVERVGSSRMPWGVVLFLAYALLILAGVGLALPTVIDLAIDTPVSLTGLVVMALLAYTIFTITLVLQRKPAARTLALGPPSLTLPPIALALAYGLPVPALFLAAFAAVLFRGLLRPAVRGWLVEA